MTVPNSIPKRAQVLTTCANLAAAEAFVAATVTAGRTVGGFHCGSAGSFVGNVGGVILTPGAGIDEGGAYFGDIRSLSAINCTGLVPIRFFR